MGPISKVFFFLIKYLWVPWTVHGTHWTVHNQVKHSSQKKKSQNAATGSCIQTGTECAFGKCVLRFPNACFAFQLLLFFLFLFYFLSRNVWLFPWTVHIVHCSQTHKFYFSYTFSLKMSPTILFTHLKIILLQCFQFSVISKRTLNVIFSTQKNYKPVPLCTEVEHACPL